MKRRSKDELRKEYRKIFDEKRVLDGEIAKQNLREDDGEKLSWDDNNDKEEKRVELEKRLEEIQRELGNNNLA